MSRWGWLWHEMREESNKWLVMSFSNCKADWHFLKASILDDGRLDFARWTCVGLDEKSSGRLVWILGVFFPRRELWYWRWGWDEVKEILGRVLVDDFASGFRMKKAPPGPWTNSSIRLLKASSFVWMSCWMNWWCWAGRYGTVGIVKEPSSSGNSKWWRWKNMNTISIFQCVFGITTLTLGNT